LEQAMVLAVVLHFQIALHPMNWTMWQAAQGMQNAAANLDIATQGFLGNLVTSAIVMESAMVNH